MNADTPQAAPAGLRRRTPRTRTLLIVGALLALVLAGVVSYYASSSPDGLEKVASDKGMDTKEKDHALADSPTADYAVKGVHNQRISGGLAGLIGVGATLVLGSGVFWVVRRSASARAAGEHTADNTPAPNQPSPLDGG